MADNKEFVEVQGEECEILRRYGNGGIGYVEGVGTARLGKKKRLSPRDKIIGDLKALGKKNTEIAAIMKGRKATVGEAISVGVTAKDPKVMNYVDQQQDEIVKEARQRLLETVPRAAEVFIESIEAGDTKNAAKLLSSVGALQGKKSESLEEVERFGDWLMQQRRQVIVGESDTDERTPRKLVTDANEIEEPTDGVRLDVDADKPG
jgi:hypothetical protein